MPTILSISDIIEIGDISTYLSANYTSKKSLFGGSVIKPQPPQQIAYITDALRWGVEGGAESDVDNRGMANYLYWLCGLFQLQAQYIMNGAGGGSVIPTPSGGAAVNDIDFIVSASTLIATGESSVLLDGTDGNPDLRGYNIDFYRNGVVQYTTPPSSGIYYRWNRVTGLLQLLGDNSEALVDEQMRISPDSGTGSSSVSPSLAPSVIVYPASWEADGVTLNLQYIVDAGEVILTPRDYTGQPLIAPTDFVYTGTGIVVSAPGFDAANFPFVVIMKTN